MSEQERPRKLSLKRGAPEQNADAPRLEERLHKVLAQAGLGSRRALEQRIADGLVRVNGNVAIVGMSVTGGDKIEIDGRTFVASALTEPARVLPNSAGLPGTSRWPTTRIHSRSSSVLTMLVDTATPRICSISAR